MAPEQHGGMATPDEVSDLDAPDAAESRDGISPMKAPTTGPGTNSRWTGVLERLSPVTDPVAAAEPVSPHTPAPADLVDGPGARSYVRVALAAVSGLIGSFLLMATGPDWAFAPGVWRLETPGIHHTIGTAPTFYFGSLFLFGVLLMALAWIGLVGHVSRRVGSERNCIKLVLAVTALWALPQLVGPIQLSTDAYSYAAQGYMATLGIDPSANGPVKLPHYDPFYRAADPIWRDAPAPYGPVAVGAAKAVVTLGGFDVGHSVFGFRLVSIFGVVLAGVGIYFIARARKVSPSLALALAVANPVVLIHLIGGAHNDALMMGLLVLGLAAFERSRKLLAVVLVALAIGVKLPAVIALAFIAWNWKGRDVDWKERLIGFPIVGAIAGSLIGVLCVVMGIGLGWLTALGSTNKVFSTFSVFTKLGFLSADGLHAVGLDVDSKAVVQGFRYVGLLLAAGLIMTLVVKSPKLGVTRGVGAAMLVLILFGPVVWPWYLPAGLALLAAAGVRKYRPSMIVLTVAASLIVWPTNVMAIDPLEPYQHWLGMLVVLIVAACCAGAQYLARYMQTRGERLGSAGFTLEAVLVGPVEEAVLRDGAEPAPRTEAVESAEAVEAPVASARR